MDSFGENIQPVLPELLLAVGSLVFLMVGAYKSYRPVQLVMGLTFGLMSVGVGLLLIILPASEPVFSNLFIFDEFSRYIKLLILVGSVMSLIMSVSFMRSEALHRFEYPILVMLSVLGMFIMVSANDLMTLYLGLELQSLSLYVIATIKRDSSRATEAGLKYFILGALSSGMLLYGASLIYGFTGQTELGQIANAIVAGERSLGLTVGLVFFLAGLAFKISAVPFHMWTPDVYEGVPTPITTFFATAPKVAAVAILMRVVIDGFASVTADWQQIIYFLSISSMLLGAFGAIGQTNIKRLMAYSSIGHIGFMLVGLTHGGKTGVEAVALYLAIYMVMTLAAFACILSMRLDDNPTEDINDLAGLGHTKPLIAITLLVLMFSMAGIPPLAGFWAKYAVMIAAIEAEFYSLAIIGVIASVISAYYYLRIVKIMFFDDSEHVFSDVSMDLKIVMVAGAFFTVFFVLFLPFLNQLVGVAATSFF